MFVERLAGFPNAVIWLQYTCLVHCQSSSTSTEDVSPLEVCWFTRGTGTNGGALSDPNGRFRMLGVGGGSLVGSNGDFSLLSTSFATNGAPGIATNGAFGRYERGFGPYEATEQEAMSNQKLRPGSQRL